MKEVTAFQRRDAQQPPRDDADALNEDPMNVDPKDVKGFQEDPMIVDENSMDPNEDVVAKARDAGEQVGDPKEALVRGKGVAL